MARGQQTEKKKKPIKYFDYSLLFLIIFLLCFGLVMLYSTSSYAGSNKFGDASYFVKRQLFATGLGIVGMYIVSKIPYRFWMKVSSMAYLAAIVLCTAVIFIGTEANGQARWLKIGRYLSSRQSLPSLRLLFFWQRLFIRHHRKWVNS